jgi:hypothetical protein
MGRANARSQNGDQAFTTYNASSGATTKCATSKIVN